MSYYRVNNLVNEVIKPASQYKAARFSSQNTAGQETCWVPMEDIDMLPSGINWRNYGK